MMGRQRRTLNLRLVAALACVGTVGAQERAGEAEIGYQHFVLTSGSRRVTNALGLTLNFREFIPDVGILSVSLAPAASNGRFRTGDNFAELKRFPWLGNYWTFRAGDFRLAGRVLTVPFNNLFYPEITGRGAWVEATHGNRTIGFLYGAETLQAGVRVPIRLQTPQTMAGGYLRQSTGERLVWGLRFLSLSNDLEKLRQSPFIAVSGTPQRSSRSGTLSALYTAAGPLKLYGEATLSAASFEQPSTSRSGPFSTTVGPLFETGPVTVRANYVYQTDSYLPLLGYYAGDRQGPFAEFHVRPSSRVELFGGVSAYSNNVARNPSRPTFRTTGESTGASVQLPSRFVVSGQWSALKLASRKSSDDSDDLSTSEQLQLTLSRPVRRHSLRVSAREFRQHSKYGSQQQRTAEVADNFQYRWFSFGAEVRAQRLIAQQSKTSLYLRGNGQLNLKRFSAYANMETGNDLANRTLFATSATSTTVLGSTIQLTRNWDFTVEAFRSRLIMELNEMNVFALQGRGVYVPAVLSRLNQWSLHFRMSKRLQWGKAVPPASGNQLDVYAIGHSQLKGSVEGFVTSESAHGRRWVEGIPVALDSGLTAVTDSGGRFQFEVVGEGAHTVGLALESLPAEYNPGANPKTAVFVKPSQRTRADFTVLAVGHTVRGVVCGPAGTSVELIMLKMLPSGKITTPDKHGRFAFYNVAEGDYQISVAPETLPLHAVLTTPTSVAVAVGGGDESPQVRFEFDVRIPLKPVRTVKLPPLAVKPAGGVGQTIPETLPVVPVAPLAPAAKK